MSADESVEFSAGSLDSIYLSDLLDSISAARDHLSGDDGTPLSPSSLSPTTAWTAQEKTTFFRALSVHSRLRPDLISNEIKTKSVQDVCNYLSVLQLATSQQETGVPYPQRRQNLPIAMEVSPEWIAIEEEKAAGVTRQEQDWQREFATEQRHAEIKLLKKVSRAQSHDVSSGQHKAALKKKIADADLRAQQEDFCGSLGPSELTAIGTILRGVTDSPGSSQIKPAVLHTPTLQHSARHVASLETVRTLPFPTTKGTDGISDNTRAQGGSSEDGEPSSLGVMTPPDPSQKQDSVALLAGLSPASRRRHQKRLYMRRRRASISGVATIDDTLERLKPGRKKVKRSSSPEDEAQLDPERLEDEGNIKRYPRMVQVAVNELGDLGLVADDLRELGVGILNPDGIAKMLKYVISHRYHCPAVLDETSLWDELSGDTSGHGSRVSMGTIRLLNAHVVWFVKNLVYRAITLREQERALKSETKVWKLSEKAVGSPLNSQVEPLTKFSPIFFTLGPRTGTRRKSRFHGKPQRAQ